MKKLIALTIAIFSLISCSSNSDSGDDTQTVNIKYEVITSRNAVAIITRTINNGNQTEEVDTMPYSFTYAQQEVSTGDYLKLTYTDNSTFAPGETWTNYTATLNIYVNNTIVKTQSFTITGSSSLVQIEYTF